MNDRLPPFGVRIPLDLKNELQKAADKNRRSLSAEIVHRLEQSVSPTDPIEQAAREARDILNRALKG
jgi:hypothetical protein